MRSCCTSANTVFVCCFSSHIEIQQAEAYSTSARTHNARYENSREKVVVFYNIKLEKEAIIPTTPAQ